MNAEAHLPFREGEFDGAAICVSIQYLTQPVDVLHEVGRVLKPNAPLAITFSNRCFPTKAVAIWQSLDDKGHILLVESYLQDTGMFAAITAHNRTSRKWGSDPLYAVIGKRKG